MCLDYISVLTVWNWKNRYFGPYLMPFSMLIFSYPLVKLLNSEVVLTTTSPVRFHHGLLSRASVCQRSTTRSFAVGCSISSVLGSVCLYRYGVWHMRTCSKGPWRLWFALLLQISFAAPSDCVCVSAERWISFEGMYCTWNFSLIWLVTSGPFTGYGSRIIVLPVYQRAKLLLSTPLLHPGSQCQCIHCPQHWIVIIATLFLYFLFLLLSLLQGSVHGDTCGKHKIVTFVSQLWPLSSPSAKYFFVHGDTCGKYKTVTFVSL